MRKQFSYILILCLVIFSSCKAFGQDVYKLQATSNSEKTSVLEKLVEERKYNEALKTAKDILNNDSKNNYARKVVGDIYCNQYKLVGAFKEYKKILELDPKNSDAYNGIGLVFYRKTTSSDMDVIRNINKYYQRSLTSFQKAIELNPNNSQAYANAAKVFEEVGDLENAQEYYEKALALRSDFSSAADGLGHVLYKKGRLDEAIKQYNEAIKLNSENSTAYYHMGEALINQGEYSKAIRFLNVSMYKFPNSAPVQNMLAKAYELQGNEAAAINSYRKAVMIKPEYTEPYLNIANIYDRRGDNDLAIAELKNAVAANPSFGEGKLKIADIALRNNNIEQSIKYYKDVMNTPRFHDDALAGLSKAYFVKAQNINSKAGFASAAEYKEVEKALKQAISYNPNDLESYLALMRLSKITGNENEAVYLKKIVDNSSYTPVALITKGEAYLTSNEYNKAQAEFKKAIESVNGVAEKINIGEIFMANKQFDVAKEAFVQALKIDPESEIATSCIEKIEKNKQLAKSSLEISKDFYNKRQYKATIENLKTALNYNPRLKEANLLLAKTLDKQGYEFNALQYYQAYLSMIDATNKDYKEISKKVESLDKKMEKYKKKNKNIKKYNLL